MPSGACPQKPEMSNYNDNLFTQNVGPNNFVKTTYTEAANGRLGISKPPQEPVNHTEGNMTYILDPNIVKPPSTKPIIAAGIDQSEVYDPRFTTYGPSNRSYIEPITGQVRYYYDDINAQNNYYVTRNKLDFMSFGQGAGPMENRNESLDEVKQKAQQHFIDNTNEQRTGLGVSNMEKYNTSIGWQRRKYPIITYGGGAGSGGFGTMGATGTRGCATGPPGSAASAGCI